MGLNTVELVLWAEKEFQVDIPSVDAEKLLTVGQLSLYIQYKRQATKGLKVLTEKNVFARIKDRLVSEYKVEANTITRTSYFAADLQLDQ